MTDVAVLVMVYPPSKALHVGTPEGEKARLAGQYLRGDIVNVYPFDRISGPGSLLIRPNGTGPGRMRYIKITGVPGTFESISGHLLASWSDEEYETHGQALHVAGHNRWKGDAVALATEFPEDYATMRDSGIVTMTWDQVKKFFRNEDGALITDADMA